MTTVVYPIQRAINRPIVFKGLQAQYILYAGISLIVDLLLFVLLYFAHVPPWICMSFVFALGITALSTAARLSRRFGRSGLMKYFASKSIPRHIRCNTRRVFINLLVNHHERPA